MLGGELLSVLISGNRLAGDFLGVCTLLPSFFMCVINVFDGDGFFFGVACLDLRFVSLLISLLISLVTDFSRLFGGELWIIINKERYL